MIVWADGADEFSLDYFVFEFINGFTRRTTFVVPTVVKRNSRFIEFQIEVTNQFQEDLLNGKVNLWPVGNWDYKLWNVATKTLNVTGGTLVDAGQMQLTDYSDVDGCTVFTFYRSDNDDDKSVVYVEECDCPIWGESGLNWSSAHRPWGYCVPTCDVWNESELVYSTSEVVWNEC